MEDGWSSGSSGVGRPARSGSDERWNAAKVIAPQRQATAITSTASDARAAARDDGPAPMRRKGGGALVRAGRSTGGGSEGGGASFSPLLARLASARRAW